MKRIQQQALAVARSIGPDARATWCDSCSAEPIVLGGAGSIRGCTRAGERKPRRREQRYFVTMGHERVTQQIGDASLPPSPIGGTGIHGGASTRDLQRPQPRRWLPLATAETDRRHSSRGPCWVRARSSCRAGRVGRGDAALLGTRRQAVAVQLGCGQRGGEQLHRDPCNRHAPGAVLDRQPAGFRSDAQAATRTVQK